MIKKLRIKFVVIMMSVVTIMLMLMLGLIMHFTRVNLETQSLDMMQRLVEQPFSLRNPNEIDDEIQLPYFILQMGFEQDIVETGGNYYDLSDNEFLKLLVDEVYSSPKTFGIIDEYKLRYRQIDTGANRCIVFSDISSELDTRNNMMQNCLIVGVISFFVFLFISIKLSKWISIPIEANLKEQKQFISDASHELKTPLTVIMTNAELLQSDECREADKSQLLNNIIFTSHRMKGLVEQMLKLSRTDNLEEKNVFNKMNLSTLLFHSILPFEPLFFEKQLVFETQITDNIIIMGQEDRIREVIEILLDNAYKYSRSEGRTVVALNLSKANRCLLTVKNEGVPLSQSDINQIFNRFYCVDKSRNDTGSFGLGLSIAENTVKQHKGEIWAESKNGWNYFKIELPCF